MSEIKQVNSKNGRYYLLCEDDGTEWKLPSITAVTKVKPNYFLDKWLLDPANREAANNSANFGRAVHSHCEAYFRGFDVESDVDYDQHNYYDFWKKNQKESGLNGSDLYDLFIHSKDFFIDLYLAECELILPKLYLCEHSVYSRRFSVAGMLDVAEKVFNPEKMVEVVNVIDIKTSSKRKSPSHLDGYKMQLAAYAACVRELYGYPIGVCRLLIGVTSTRSLQVVEIDSLELQYYLKMFASLRDEYREIQGF